jgi:hypothetical protein
VVTAAAMIFDMMVSSVAYSLLSSLHIFNKLPPPPTPTIRSVGVGITVGLVGVVSVVRIAIPITVWVTGRIAVVRISRFITVAVAVAVARS